MKRLLLQLALLFVMTSAHAQEMIDRVVVVVNNHVITQTDWDEQERFEALAEGRPANVQHSPAALERLVDRVLILQQMAELNFRAPNADEIKREVEDIRKQLPKERAGTDAAWSKTLKEYNIPEDDFARLVAEQANVQRFIDVRFRANARIAPFETESYYRDTFLSEFRKSAGNAPPPSLKQVQDKIQEILAEQRVTEGLNSFVQSLRAQAVIRRVDSSSMEPAANTGPAK